QTLFCVVAADVDQILVVTLELTDDGLVVAVAHVDTLVQSDFNAFLCEAVAHLSRHAATVGLLIVHDGDGLGVEYVGNVSGGERTLLVVAANGAEEEVWLDGVSDQGRRGSRRDRDNTFVLVDVHSRHRGAGACVCNGEFRARIDHAVGGRHGLLGLAAVVDEQRFQLLALDAARRVEGLDGGQCARLDLVSVLGGRTRHGLRNADLDRFGIHAAGERHGTDSKGNRLDADIRLHPRGLQLVARVVTFGRKKLRQPTYDGSGPPILRFALGDCHYGYALNDEEFRRILGKFARQFGRPGRRRLHGGAHRAGEIAIGEHLQGRSGGATLRRHTFTQCGEILV